MFEINKPNRKIDMLYLMNYMKKKTFSLRIFIKIWYYIISEQHRKEKSMFNVKLVLNMEEKIASNEIDTRNTIQNQIQRFRRLLVERITQKYCYFDKETLNDLFDLVFKDGLTEEVNEMINDYKKSEMDFYIGHFKTVDLIFNTLKDKRIQIIYLENVIKKINENKIEINDEIFKKSRNEGRTSIDTMFDKFAQNVLKSPNISIEEMEDIYELLTRYYKMYKQDFLKTINNFIDDNWKCAINLIETEIDSKQLRNGKTSAVSKIEKIITNNALKLMDEFLEKELAKYDLISKKQLELCSKKVVELIFELLPEDYQDQRGFLEVIVDTNIQERLGSYLKTESIKVFNNLKEKNNDKISNELYEEKRYKNIEEYECGLKEMIEIYSNVLHEIAIAYDIPENNISYLKMLNSIESNGVEAQISFRKLFEYVKRENDDKLNSILLNMHSLSKKAENEILEEVNKTKR